MGKVWSAIVAVVASLALSVAIVGCGSSTSPTKDKMTGGQMKDNKMHDDKMGSDGMKDGKMGSPKMGSDKMDQGKMDGDKKGKM
jgi:pentapeptide MXKDX repeat protein